MVSIRFEIQHPIEADCKLVGIIEQHEEGVSRGRPIALILHGTLGHKNYLYQKKLAQRLPIDSCRFDFRAHYESTGGTFSMGRFGYLADVEDIEIVATYLEKEYGYNIELIVGHSRNSNSAMKWISVVPEARRPSFFVNIAGRYRMWSHTLFDMFKDDLAKHGYGIWKATINGETHSRKVPRKDMEELRDLDMSFIWKDFPAGPHVLTIIGMRDAVVDPYDGIIFARAFSGRDRGTHTLHYIEKADHGFYGHYDELVGTILEWMSSPPAKDGIWKEGVIPEDAIRPKL